MSETLAEIFAKNPLNYTLDGSDEQAIIARMREARAQFELGAKTKVAERNTPAKRAKQTNLLAELGINVLGEEHNAEDDLKKLGLI